MGALDFILELLVGDYVTISHHIYLDVFKWSLFLGLLVFEQITETAVLEIVA
jgi:hypothetical protein